MILLSLLFSTFAHASDCTLQKGESVNCEIYWSEGEQKYAYQLYTSQNGCEFPEGKKRTCTRLRLCVDNVAKEHGASVLMEPQVPSFYCETKQPVDLFSGSQKGIEAYVQCERETPKSIQLKTLKDSKVCNLPLWKERK